MFLFFPDRRGLATPDFCSRIEVAKEVLGSYIVSRYNYLAWLQPKKEKPVEIRFRYLLV
jgi:hypothetical protein